jgi:hypothetical protein
MASRPPTSIRSTRAPRSPLVTWGSPFVIAPRNDPAASATRLSGGASGARLSSLCRRSRAASRETMSRGSCSSRSPQRTSDIRPDSNARRYPLRLPEHSPTSRSTASSSRCRPGCRFVHSFRAIAFASSRRSPFESTCRRKVMISSSSGTAGILSWPRRSSEALSSQSRLRAREALRPRQVVSPVPH